MRILVLKWSLKQSLHRTECVIQALTVSCLGSFFAFRITGRIWRKSPPSTTSLPPIRLSSCMMSLKVRSRASRRYLWLIGASSHTISFAIFNRRPFLSFGEMLHVDVSRRKKAKVTKIKCSFYTLSMLYKEIVIKIQPIS